MDEYDWSNLVPVDTIKHIHREYELKKIIAAEKPAFVKKHLKARGSWSYRYKSFSHGKAWLPVPAGLPNKLPVTILLQKYKSNL